jgi:hypothetical protein
MNTKVKNYLLMAPFSCLILYGIYRFVADIGLKTSLLVLGLTAIFMMFVSGYFNMKD